jgi:CubicO group peptidase (beta-lactamase class C family)
MSPTLSREAQTQLQSLLDEQVTAGHMPSVHLTVASPTSVLFTGRAGVLDPLDPKSRQTKPDDTMWFASTSKLITSVIYLQLVDRGLLTLDTDMRKKFAPLDKVAERIWGGVKDGQPVWKGEYKGPVKLGWLLNQSSGFGGEFGDEVQAWKAYSDVGKGFVNSCKVVRTLPNTADRRKTSSTRQLPSSLERTMNTETAPNGSRSCFRRSSAKSTRRISSGRCAVRSA